MVRLFVLLIFSLFLYSGTLAEDLPQARIQSDKNSVEMGKYLRVKIIYSGYQPVDDSDLSSWSDDFYIDRAITESETLSDGVIITTQSLRLYPRSTGDKVLHALALGGAVARPIKISVLPALRNGINGTPHWLKLPKSIWQGQSIRLSIVQNLLHPANQVVVDKALFPGFDVLGPDQQHQAYLKHNKEYQRVQLNWLLTPRSTGDLSLEAPAIVQRGRGRWKFYLSRLQLNVKPLPSYLPVTLPVGKVSLKTSLFYKHNKPYWSLEIHNNGRLPDEVYGIRRQLAAIAAIEPEAVYFSDTSSKNQQQSDSASAWSEGFKQRYEIPVPPWTLALLSTPELSVDYFDVSLGHLKTLSASLPEVSYIPEKWRYVLIFAGAVVLIVLSVWLLKWLLRIAAWRHYIKQLKQVDDADQLRQLLIKPGQFLTLDAWSENTGSGHVQDVAGQIARRLNALCFSPSDNTAVRELKQQLIELYTFQLWLKYNHK